MVAPIRCAVYLRVSTRDQRLSPQWRDVRAAVEARGWKIVRVYRERRSAKAGAERPQWAQLRKDAARRRFGAVAVWSLDRMGRSSIDLLTAVRAFEARKTKLLIVREDIDTTGPVGHLTLTILAAVAEMERDRIAERTRAGLEGARARGVRLGRPVAQVPARQLRDIIAGRVTAADVARDLGLSSRTVRNRVKEERNGGS